MSSLSDPQNKNSAQPAGYWFESMPLTSAHWAAGMVIFFTFAIEAWEMLILIYSTSSIAAEFDLSIQQIGTLISAMFLGMIPGSLIWGQLSSSLGRKKCLMISIGLYFIFPILSANATSYDMLWWVRFFAGMMISGALVVSFPLFMEQLPVAVRGRATVLLSAGWPVGTLMALAVTTVLADEGWRTIMGFSTIVSLWVILIYKLVPESAYWLAEKGQVARSEEIIKHLSNNSIDPKVRPVDEQVSSIPFTEIFKGNVLKVTIIVSIVNFCFSWGYWGMTSWLPPLLADRGLSGEQGLQFIALSTLFMFPGYIAASFLTGRLGRKKVMVGFVALSTIAGVGFGLSESLTQMYIWNFTLSFFSLGAWGIWNTWMSEVFNTANRGQGTAWGIMLQRVANTIAPIVIGGVFAASGFGPTILFISGFLGLTLIAVLFLNETEGERLT